MIIIKSILHLVLFAILSVGVVFIWYFTAPKLSTGKPIYAGIIPAMIVSYIDAFIVGIYTNNLSQRLLGVLWVHGFFLLIWLFAVLIQYCRPNKRVFAPYRSYYEHNSQDSSRFTKAFPFPRIKSRISGEQIACILNPLAWYEYLIWWLMYGSEKQEAILSDPRPSIVLIKPLGEGTVTAQELIARDYPGVIGKRVDVLHAGDNIAVYQTNVIGWYGYIVDETVDYWPERSPDDGKRTSVRYVSRDYIHLAEP